MNKKNDLEIFKNNLKTLQEVNPELTARVMKHVRAHGLNVPEIDENGIINLRLQKPDGSIGWFYGCALNDHLDKLTKEIASTYNPICMLWFGIGLGHHLNAYLQKPHNLNKYTILIEPHMQVFCSYLAATDQTSIIRNPNVTFLVELSIKEIEAQFLKLQDSPDFLSSSDNYLFVEWGYQHPTLKEIQDAWKRVIADVHFATDVLHIDAFVGFYNFVQSIQHVIKSPLLSEFADSCKNTSGFLVGTGPSLEHSLDGLRKVQNSSVIVAADSALRTLKENGITPHIVICLERHIYTADFFKEIDTTDMILVTTPVIHADVYNSFKGSIIHVARPNNFLPWIYPDSPVTKGRTMCVAHLGFLALRELGVDNIYLVGNDLSFAPDTNQSHVSGYEWNYLQDVYEEQLNFSTCEALAHTGETRKTLTFWSQCAKIFEQLIAQHKGPVFNVIPRTHGIIIEGAQQIEPNNIFSQTFPETTAIKSIKNKYTLKQNGEETFNKLKINTIAELSAIVNKCISLQNELLRVYEQLPAEDNKSNESLNTATQLLFKMEKEAQEISQTNLFTRFFWAFVYGRHIQLERLSYGLLGESIKDYVGLRKKMDFVARWFAEIITKGQLVITTLQNSDSTIKNRK